MDVDVDVDGKGQWRDEGRAGSMVEDVGRRVRWLVVVWVDRWDRSSRG